MRHGRAVLLALCALLGAPGAAADDPGPGAYFDLGLHGFYALDPGRGAWGPNASLLLRPGSLAHLSRRLADRELGFLVRWSRQRLGEGIELEGAEMNLRRYLDRGGPLWHPFLGGGLGQSHLRREAGDSGRWVWTAGIEGGVERSLGSRWLLSLAWQNRWIESFEGGSLGSALFLSLGARIDP